MVKTKFFDLAKKLSAKSNHRQHRLGCVIVRRDKVVAVGFNSVKTHPKSTAKYNMLHAEIDAVLSAYGPLNNCEAYVYREDRMGNWAMSKPCKGCENLMRSAGISRVHYTVNGSYDTYEL